MEKALLLDAAAAPGGGVTIMRGYAFAPLTVAGMRIETDCTAIFLGVIVRVI